MKPDNRSTLSPTRKDRHLLKQTLSMLLDIGRLAQHKTNREATATDDHRAEDGNLRSAMDFSRGAIPGPPMVRLATMSDAGEYFLPSFLVLRAILDLSGFLAVFLSFCFLILNPSEEFRWTVRLADLLNVVTGGKGVFAVEEQR
jgi:hypothetical protein